MTRRRAPKPWIPPTYVELTPVERNLVAFIDDLVMRLERGPERRIDPDGVTRVNTFTVHELRKIIRRLTGD